MNLIHHKYLENLSWLKILTNFVPYFLILLLYILILQLSLPSNWVALLSGDLPYKVGFGFLALSISFRLPTRFEKWVSLTFVIVLFSLPLIYIWHTGDSNLARIGGLLPGSDAGGLLRISEFLLDGKPLQLGWKRPLSPGFLAFILWLTQRNIVIVQALLTGLAAVSCFVASRELKRTFGNSVAVITVIGTFSFYEGFTGTLMSESLGLILGVLSFAVLLRGGDRREEGLVLAGIALLTIGLCARMGAILILPLLILWGGILFRKNRFFSWSFAVKAFLLTVFFVVLNSQLSTYISDGNYQSFGNYSHVLYGLLTGGTWESIFTDHPDILLISDSEEVVEHIYQYCFDIIAQDPMSLIRGLLRSFSVMLDRGSLSFFSIRTDIFISPQLISNLLIRPLLCVGLVGCIWRSRFFLDTNSRSSTNLVTLLLAFVVGTLLSAPLAPLWDAGWRPYATTIVSLYTLLGLGLAYVIAVVSKLSIYRRLSSYASSLLPTSTQSSVIFRRTQSEVIFDTEGLSATRSIAENSAAKIPMALILGVLIAGISFLSPFFLKSITPAWVRSTQRCSPGVERLEVYINPASVIRLYPDNELEMSKVPNFHVSDFKALLTTLAEGSRSRLPFFKDIANQLEENTAILNVVGGSSLPILSTSLLPEKAGHVIICYEREEFLNTERRSPIGFTVFHGKSLQIRDNA